MKRLPNALAPGLSVSSLERIWQHGFEASALIRYGVGVVLATAAALFRISINQLWGTDFPFIFYFPMTLFIALYGGLGPALVGVVITTVMTVVWVFPPIGHFVLSPTDRQGVMVYLSVDALIAWIGSRHRRVLNDRNKAEREVRSSEQRFRTMADGAPVMIWLSGTDKRCTWFNQQWLQFTGRTMEQELGNGWAESMHEEDFDRCLKTYMESFDARQPFMMEYRLRRNDGEWRWVVDHGVPLYKAEEFAGYIGSCIDVTSQKEAAELLSERERELETIINRTPFMLSRCSRDLRYRFVSAGYAQMVGRKPEDVAGKPIAEIIGEQGFKTILPYIDRVLSGESVHYETGVHFQGVGVRLLNVSYTPERDQQGNVEGWIASVLDVSDREQAQAALRESETRLRQLLGLLPVGVYTIKAPNGEVTYYNEQAATLWGRRPRLGDTEERWCGSFRLWMPDGSPLAHDSTPMTQALSEGRSFRNLHVVIERPPPESSRITVLVNIDPIVDDSGRIVGAINVFHDVTALRETEKALREALKTKDRFLASISHELRTPLTPVLLTTDMLQQNKTLPQPVKTALDIIHRNVQLEAKLVNDLLDVSRATIGKLRVELSDCDIHEIVERAVRVCLAPGDGNQSNIATKLNAPQRNCPGDATRLQQVFWNLIQNAMKCTSRAGSITISSRNENGDVCIDVSDTGCGIEPTKLEGIFEPFTGEKHGISGHGGQSGFGLGLFIARQIVIAHGGTLVAKSQGLNRGATFTVSLPACREEQHSPE